MRPQVCSLSLLLSSLLLNACGDTIVIPAAGSNGTFADQGSTTGSGTQQTSSNMTSGTAASTTMTGTSGTTNTTSSTNQIFADSSQQTTTTDLTDVPAGSVAGLTGEDVNCVNTVPCRWVSADGQYALTVTNTDNIASRDRLSVNFAVTTLHDSTLSVGSIDDAIDSASTRTKASDMVLGEGNGGTPVSITAGTKVLGTVNYADTASSNLLSHFSISILDNGLARKATLFNLPIGPVTTDYAQCNNTLPCVWASPDSQVTIKLLSVGGYAGNGRLTANFQVISTYDMDVSVDSGAEAVGNEGTRFSSRTHALGSISDFEKLTEEAIANIGIAGSVDFFRTSSIPTSLLSLDLVLFEESPTPRWNPRFVSVPVQ